MRVSGVAVLVACVVGLATVTAGDEGRGCPWKACPAGLGPRCYRQDAHGAVTELECPQGTVFNALACAFQDEAHVCVTPAALVAEAASLRSQYDPSLVCDGPDWKGAMGRHCFKRFSNRQLMTEEGCRLRCSRHLVKSEMAELNSIAKNVYVRELGGPDNQYWAGLTLNHAGDGWTWVSDGSALTPDQAMFDIPLDQKIAELKAANGGRIDPDSACVVQERGHLDVAGVSVTLPFVWRVVPCTTRTQCMCQAAATAAMCPWKACAGERGPGCYYERHRGAWREARCPNAGDVFNTLICAYQDGRQVCVTPPELKKEALSLDGNVDLSRRCRGKHWKGPIGRQCYKRFGNDNQHAYPACRAACQSELHVRARLPEVKTVAANVYVRQMGYVYNSYWLGLRLNLEESGWQWESDGSPLTDDQARFGRPIAEEIAALRAVHGGVVPPSMACVVSEDGAYTRDEMTATLAFGWRVVPCGMQMQCMCEKKAEEKLRLF